MRAVEARIEGGNANVDCRQAQDDRNREVRKVMAHIG
jgi:hypothetical protein